MKLVSGKKETIKPKRKYFACMQSFGCYEFDSKEEQDNWVNDCKKKYKPYEDTLKDINIKLVSGTKETIKRYLRPFPTTTTKIAETIILVVGSCVYLPIIIVISTLYYPFYWLKNRR